MQKLFFVVSAWFVVGAFVCVAQPALAAAAKQPVTSPCLASSVTRFPKKISGIGHIFYGTLAASTGENDKTVHFTMQVIADGHGHLTGKYAYQKQKQCLYLQGTSEADSPNHWHLQETDARGRMSGRWDVVYQDGFLKGSWKSTSSPNKIWTPLNDVAIQEIKNTIPDPSRLDGEYFRDGYGPSDPHYSAFIYLLMLDPETVRYYGETAWPGFNAPPEVLAQTGGPNVGETDGKMPFADLSKSIPKAFLDADHTKDENCVALIHRINRTTIEVADNGACGGLNANFTGTYKKARG